MVDVFGKINLKQNEAEFLKVHSGTSFPVSPSPVAGQLFYRTDQNQPYYYNGSGWEILTGTGTVTSVASGNGMNFSTITTSGTVTLGTPSTCNAASTNNVTTNSHTHAITGFVDISGDTMTGALNVQNADITITHTGTSANTKILNVRGRRTGTAGTVGEVKFINGEDETESILETWRNTSGRLDFNFRDGRVGIDKTNPGYLLDVNGDINIASGSNYKINGSNLSASDVSAVSISGDTMTGNLWFSGGTRYIGTSSNNDFYIRTNDVNRMRFFNSSTVQCHAIFRPDSNNSRDLGTSSLKWRHGYFFDITTGDLNLMNGWKLVEYENDDRNDMINGVIIKNKNNEVVFKITDDGLYYKGKKVKTEE